MRESVCGEGVWGVGVQNGIFACPSPTGQPGSVKSGTGPLAARIKAKRD